MKKTKSIFHIFLSIMVNKYCQKCKEVFRKEAREKFRRRRQKARKGQRQISKHS